MVRSIVAKVKELQVDYGIEQIFHILQAEGHDPDVISAAIISVFDTEEKPPESYSDVRHIVEATLCSEPSRKIVRALTCSTNLGQIMTPLAVSTLDLESCINYIQSHRSEGVLNEIHESLEPFIDGLIASTATAAKESAITYASSESERQIWDQWREMFGIWLPETQRAFNERLERVGSEIMAETYEDGGEYTYCPKYDTEINIHSVCHYSKCPFYEIKSSSGSTIKYCKFKK